MKWVPNGPKCFALVVGGATLAYVSRNPDPSNELEAWKGSVPLVSGSLQFMAFHQTEAGCKAIMEFYILGSALR